MDWLWTGYANVASDGYGNVNYITIPSFSCVFVFQVNKTLTLLRLDLNNIGPDGAGAIAEALKVRK